MDSLPEEHEELFRAARALFKTKTDAEEEIIPTLVFAAASEDVPVLAEVRKRFAEAGTDLDAWGELRGDFHEAYARLFILDPLIDGVPIVYLKNVFIQPYASAPDNKAIDRISIDVWRRPGKLSDDNEIARLYGKCLAENGISADSECGSFGWMEFEDHLRVLVRPLDVEVHPLGRLFVGSMPPDTGQRAFPLPEVVQDMCKAVAWGPAKRVFADRERGRKPEAYNLIPAVVAWYVGDQGKRVKKAGEWPSMARLLNNRLLEPLDKLPIPERSEGSHRVWELATSAPTVRYIRNIDNELRSRAWLLHKFF